jgi:hypothetical protein
LSGPHVTSPSARAVPGRQQHVPWFSVGSCGQSQAEALLSQRGVPFGIAAVAMAVRIGIVEGDHQNISSTRPFIKS